MCKLILSKAVIFPILLYPGLSRLTRQSSPSGRITSNTFGFLVFLPHFSPPCWTYLVFLNILYKTIQQTSTNHVELVNKQQIFPPMQKMNQVQLKRLFHTLKKQNKLTANPPNKRQLIKIVQASRVRTDLWLYLNLCLASVYCPIIKSIPLITEHRSSPRTVNSFDKLKFYSVACAYEDPL